jgi:hypothetical protein
MKNLDRVFLIAGLISFSFLVGVSSCDSNEENDSKPDQRLVSSRLKEGQWKISNYVDEHEETHLFYGYSFEFNKDGSLTATNLNSSVGGTWSTFDAPNDQVKLNFEFALVEPFDELNSDWEIIESTETQIVMKHRSGTSTTERLVFERN